MSSIKTYLIAFIMRSGSTLLSDYLTTNGLGQPTEYFQYPFGVRNRWLYDQLGVAPNDFTGYMRELLAQRASNDIFGAKIAWNQKNALIEKAKQSDPAIQNINDLFPGIQWIYMRRYDKFAQAISVWRAAATSQWHANQLPTGITWPEYNFSQILAFLSLILIEEQLWNHYFECFNIQPHALYYEDLIKDPAGVMIPLINYIQGSKKILENPSELQLNTSLIRLSDQNSEKMRSRFLEDLHHVGASDYWQSFSESHEGSTGLFPEWTAQAWLDFFNSKKRIE